MMSDLIRSRKTCLVIRCICVILISLVLPGIVSANTFLVTNTNDSGGGSLRSNIAGANAAAGPDTIIFSIPGSGPHSIQPLSQLPTITETLFINGYSQAGAAPATQADPAVLKIEIDGSLAGSSTMGLDIFAPNCIITGLCINRFDGYGIQIATYDGNVIIGNYIGTDITGMMDYGNGDSGIYIYCSDYSVIGYDTPHDRNVISGNDNCGIEVEGNVSIPVYGTMIRANYIGMGVDGMTDVGNTAWGIDMLQYVQGSFIGGEDDNNFNTIAFNNTGICIFGTTCYDNYILRNSIHRNDNLGIDLDRDGVTPNDPGDGDAGGNGDQNFPVLSSAVRLGGDTKITGTFNSNANEDFRIEFFYNTERDTSNYGEGEVWIGYIDVGTDGSGNASFSEVFSVSIPDSVWVTATATDADGNTSEFSKQVFVSDLQVSIEWPDLWFHWYPFNGAYQYWVFGESNNQNFEVDLEAYTNRLVVLEGDQTSWTSTEGVGDIDINMTYQIMAVDDMLEEIGRTNPAGEFDYMLQ